MKVSLLIHLLVSSLFLSLVFCLDRIDRYDLQEATEYDIEIYFFDRNNSAIGVKVDSRNSTSIFSSGFAANRNTIFIIHGWQNEIISSFNEKVKSAYLTVEDVNVFVVDWSAITVINNTYAQSQVEFVGQVVGTQINSLVSNTDLSGRQITIVGHCLGAHVAGIAGSVTGGLIAQIVGLDPTLQGFSINDNEERLDASDANFVQVIHTCSGVLGTNETLGDADYWPNGGECQPGCNDDTICSHNRAYLYFAESVISGNFISTRCDGYDQFLNGSCQDEAISWMGQVNIDSEASGNYYLETNADIPYAKG